MELALDGLPGAAIFTDDMDASQAARSLKLTLPADSTKRLRVYAVGGRSARDAEFAFTLRALDEQGGSDRNETKFKGIEGSE